MNSAMLTTLSHVFGADASPGQETVDLHSTITQGDVMSKTSHANNIKTFISFLCFSLAWQDRLQMMCAVCG